MISPEESLPYVHNPTLNHRSNASRGVAFSSLFRSFLRSTASPFLQLVPRRTCRRPPRRLLFRRCAPAQLELFEKWPHHRLVVGRRRECRRHVLGLLYPQLVINPSRLQLGGDLEQLCLAWRLQHHLPHVINVIRRTIRRRRLRIPAHPQGCSRCVGCLRCHGPNRPVDDDVFPERHILYERVVWGRSG